MARTKKSKTGPSAEINIIETITPDGEALPDLNSVNILVSEMNRFLVRLGSSEIFQSSGIGLPEWNVLRVATRDDPVTTHEIARELGLTLRRTNEIVQGLVDSGLVILGAEESSSRARAVNAVSGRDIINTALGNEALSSINRELETAMVGALGSRVSVVERLRKNLRLLMRMTAAKSTTVRRGSE